MKKVFSGILCFSMLLGLSMPVFAATENNTLLTYANASSYEISIPADVNIDVSTGIGSIQVEVTSANLDIEDSISVSMKSENYLKADDGYWKWNLVNTKDETKTLGYTVKVGTRYIPSGEDILHTAQAKSVNLNIAVIDELSAGTYTDNLTFVSEIKNENRNVIYNYYGNPEIVIDENNLVTINTNGVEALSVVKINESDGTTTNVDFTEVSNGVYTFSGNKTGIFKVWLNDVNDGGDNDYMFSILEYSKYEVDIDFSTFTGISLTANNEGITTITDSVGYAKLECYEYNGEELEMTEVSDNVWEVQTIGGEAYSITGYRTEEDIQIADFVSMIFTVAEK